jgi:cytidylate kinase
VVASLDCRVHRFAERHSLSLSQAAKQINSISKDRTNFIGRYFNVLDDEPTRFDLLLNVERMTFAQAVETILSALKLRGIT